MSCLARSSFLGYRTVVKESVFPRRPVLGRVHRRSIQLSATAMVASPTSFDGTDQDNDVRLQKVSSLPIVGSFIPSYSNVPATFGPRCEEDTIRYPT
eukprot:scaffold11639_cov172-Amphora_coffeaeformis.AAC.33